MQNSGWLLACLLAFLIDWLIDWLTVFRHVSTVRLLVPINVVPVWLGYSRISCLMSMLLPWNQFAGKLTRYYSQYCALAFCSVHKCVNCNVWGWNCNAINKRFRKLWIGAIHVNAWSVELWISYSPFCAVFEFTPALHQTPLHVSLYMRKVVLTSVCHVLWSCSTLVSVVGRLLCFLFRFSESKMSHCTNFIHFVVTKCSVRLCLLLMLKNFCGMALTQLWLTRSVSQDLIAASVANTVRIFFLLFENDLLFKFCHALDR